MLETWLCCSSFLNSLSLKITSRYNCLYRSEDQQRFENAGSRCGGLALLIGQRANGLYRFARVRVGISCYPGVFAFVGGKPFVRLHLIHMELQQTGCGLCNLFTLMNN